MSERLATPDVPLAAKGVQGEPPMPNHLTCRHNTKSAFKDVVMLHGHNFEVYLSKSCIAVLGVLQQHPKHVPLGLVITKNGIAACLQHQECTSSTPFCMGLQCMTSRAAAILLRESKSLLIASFMATDWDIHSQLLTTT